MDPRLCLLSREFHAACLPVTPRSLDLWMKMVQIARFEDGTPLKSSTPDLSAIAGVEKATVAISECYPTEIQPPQRTVMPLLGVFLCVARIALPIIHTTFLYAIHPSKINFLALQLAAIGLGVLVSGIAVVQFFRSVPSIVTEQLQLREYYAWVKRNQSEKAVSTRSLRSCHTVRFPVSLLHYQI